MRIMCPGRRAALMDLLPVLGRRTVVTVTILGGALGAAQPVAADGPLESLPSYDRYQLVTKQLSELVVGGRVERVRWEEDGLRFGHRDRTYHFDFSTRILTEVPKGEEEQVRSTPQARRGRGVLR